MSAKKMLITVAASVALGAIIGMLYAPVEGVEARKKLKKLKRKLAFGTGCADDDRETLEEMSAALQKELEKINAKLEKI